MPAQGDHGGICSASEARFSINRAVKFYPQATHVISVEFVNLCLSFFRCHTVHQSFLFEKILHPLQQHGISAKLLNQNAASGYSRRLRDKRSNMEARLKAYLSQRLQLLGFPPWVLCIAQPIRVD